MQLLQTAGLSCVETTSTRAISWKLPRTTAASTPTKRTSCDFELTDIIIEFIQLNVMSETPLLSWPSASLEEMAAETTSVPMAASDAATVAEKIAQCMRMLAGKTDEHKFAGLLMVTKLGDLPAEQLQQVRRQVLTTVGVSFFLRLLHTKGTSTASIVLLLILRS